MSATPGIVVQSRPTGVLRVNGIEQPPQLSRSLCVSMHSQARAAPPYTPHGICPLPRALQSPVPTQILSRFAGAEDGHALAEIHFPLQSKFGDAHRHLWEVFVKPGLHVKPQGSFPSHSGVEKSGYVQPLEAAAVVRMPERMVSTRGLPTVCTAEIKTRFDVTRLEMSLKQKH